MRHRRHLALCRQWGWPTGLAVLTLFGLLSALLGEGGVWWWLSWPTLSAPLFAAAHHLRRARKGGDRARARTR